MNELPPQHLRTALFAKSGELSMLPAVATEALRVARDPNCEANDLAGLIERDPNLATDLLTLANSAVFSGGRSVTTLRQAVVRLGFRQCKNLILTTCAASSMKALPLQEEWVREVLWEHSYSTATACSHLNREMKVGFQGEEFTAGLLHDFGRLLLAIVTPEAFADADKLDFTEDESVLQNERNIMGTDHCCFGAWFADHNGLPEQLIAAIGLHHGFPEADHPHRRLVALVAAGDHIANHLQGGGTCADYDLESNRGVQQLSSELQTDLTQRFVGTIASVVDAIQNDIAEGLKPMTESV